MKGLGPIAVAALVASALLSPAPGGWAFAAAEFAFLTLKARAREALEADEADIVQRYPLYFARPALARECASTLAAVGLASFILAPWLTYKAQFAQA